MTPAPNTQSYHDDFIDRGRYLRASSARTVRTYRQGLRALADTPLTKAGLGAWMIALRERSLTRAAQHVCADGEQLLS
jgi:hypothetical protein